MSTYVEQAETEEGMCCASCGITEVDDIKLKKCADCDLVRYCSDTCQREYAETYKHARKEPLHYYAMKFIQASWKYKLW